MKRFAVQCMVATYDMTVVTVEAVSLDAACRAAIQKAATQGDWEGLDIYGPVFVDGLVENPSDDPLQDIYDDSLDVPPRYGEGGQG